MFSWKSFFIVLVGQGKNYRDWADATCSLRQVLCISWYWLLSISSSLNTFNSFNDTIQLTSNSFAEFVPISYFNFRDLNNKIFYLYHIVSILRGWPVWASHCEWQEDLQNKFLAWTQVHLLPSLRWRPSKSVVVAYHFHYCSVNRRRAARGSFVCGTMPLSEFVDCVTWIWCQTNSRHYVHSSWCCKSLIRGWFETRFDLQVTDVHTFGMRHLALLYRQAAWLSCHAAPTCITYLSRQE